MYTIKQASARTGVSVPVLRAWQRRYGVVSPERTAAGYRLYSEDDIARLRAMRRLVATGWSPSAAATSLEGATADAVASLRWSSADAGSLVERFAMAASDMDTGTLEELLDEMTSLGTFEHVAETYLLPALVAVGAAWERGTLDVAAEHAASHAVLRRLSGAFDAAARTVPDARPVLVGLPPGARHELGALAFSVVARRSGLAVTYLGADLPIEDWVDAASRSSARAAVVTIPTVSDRDAASRVVAALRDAAPDLHVAVGGRGAREAGPALGAAILPESLGDAVDALTEALGARSAAR